LRKIASPERRSNETETGYRQSQFVFHFSPLVLCFPPLAENWLAETAVYVNEG